VIALIQLRAPDVVETMRRVNTNLAALFR
jgi:hypothetical protein